MPCEFGDAGIGAVEEPDAVGAAVDGEGEVGQTADEDAVAEPAVHGFHHGAHPASAHAAAAAGALRGVVRWGCACVDELVVGADSAVLDDPEEFLGAGGEGEFFLFFVGDDDEPGEAVVDLLGGAHVRVRVVPVGAGAVDDGEGADELLILADGEAWVAVGFFGDVETVPVDDGRFAEVIAEADADELAAAEAEDGAEVGIG